MPGILGKKVGMTRVLDTTGNLIPVSVIQCEPNKVVGLRTREKEGYQAFLAGFLAKKRPTKTKKFQHLVEFRCEEENFTKKIGEEISVQDFADVAKVKITGFSRGRGFAGVIKRHNFSRGPESHGSHHHRQPGSSSGVVSGTGRVPKGKRFPGHLGSSRVTKNLVPVISIDAAKNLIVVKGPVPGARNSLIEIRSNHS